MSNYAPWLHLVIDARTGRRLLEGATDAQFDRWYDHHSHWRQARGPEDASPEVRAMKFDVETVVHFLVEDQD